VSIGIFGRSKDGKCNITSNACKSVETYWTMQLIYRQCRFILNLEVWTGPEGCSTYVSIELIVY
jgi:hypothetical protein